MGGAPGRTGEGRGEGQGSHSQRDTTHALTFSGLWPPAPGHLPGHAHPPPPHPPHPPHPVCRELLCSPSLLGEQLAPGLLSHSRSHWTHLGGPTPCTMAARRGVGAAWGVWEATESPPCTVRSGRRPRPAATLPLVPWGSGRVASSSVT